MKFEVGNKIKIVKADDEPIRYDEYIRKIFTIRDIDEYCGRKIVRLKETEYISPYIENIELAKSTKEELLKMPFGTKIITDKEEENEFLLSNEGCFANCGDGINILDSDITDDLEITDSNCGTKILEIQEPTYTTIWKRDTEVRKMTLSEVCEKLGYDVEIIKEEE